MGETTKLNLIKVGERVKEVREAKKLSQTALAEKMFVSQNVIAKIEKGKTAKVNLDHIHKIADICGVLEDYLLLRCDYRTINDLWSAGSDEIVAEGQAMETVLRMSAQCAGLKMNVDSINLGELSTKKCYHFTNDDGKEVSYTAVEIDSFFLDVKWYAECLFKRMIEKDSIVWKEMEVNDG